MLAEFLVHSEGVSATSTSRWLVQCFDLMKNGTYLEYEELFLSLQSAFLE